MHCSSSTLLICTGTLVLLVLVVVVSAVDTTKQTPHARPAIADHGSTTIQGDDLVLRVWIEDFIFREGESDILQSVIRENPSLFELAGVTKQKQNSYPHRGESIGEWDYLLTNRAGARDVFAKRTGKLRGGVSSPLARDQMVSVTLGMDAVTQKSGLVESLWNAYGGMADVMPLSFALPGGIEMMKEYMRQNDDEVWVLKENKHRGQGVTPVLFRDIPGMLVAKQVENMKKNKSSSSGYVLAQKFIGKQFLIDKVPFTFRIWTVFGGGWNTSRAYVFDGSIVPFGDKEIDVKDGVDDVLQQAKDLIVNLFLQDRSKARDSWSMGQLKEYLRNMTGNDAAFDGVWDRVKRSTARTLAAAVPKIRSEFSKYEGYQGGNVEILGVDFVVDDSLTPWLIEVNYLPSMARKVVGCVMSRDGEDQDVGDRVLCQGSVFDRQKERFMDSFLHVLQRRHAKMSENRMIANMMYSNRTLSCGVVDEHVFAEVLDMLDESRHAERRGFSSLNLEVYRSLHMMAEKNRSRWSWVIDVLERVQKLLRRVPYASVVVRPGSTQSMNSDRSIGSLKNVDEAIYGLLTYIQDNKTQNVPSAEEILEILCQFASKKSSPIDREL